MSLGCFVIENYSPLVIRIRIDVQNVSTLLIGNATIVPLLEFLSINRVKVLLGRSKDFDWNKKFPDIEVSKNCRLYLLSRLDKSQMRDPMPDSCPRTRKLVYISVQQRSKSMLVQTESCIIECQMTRFVLFQFCFSMKSVLIRRNGFWLEINTDFIAKQREQIESFGILW